MLKAQQATSNQMKLSQSSRLRCRVRRCTQPGLSWESRTRTCGQDSLQSPMFWAYYVAAPPTPTQVHHCIWVQTCASRDADSAVCHHSARVARKIQCCPEWLSVSSVLIWLRDDFIPLTVFVCSWARRGDVGPFPTYTDTHVYVYHLCIEERVPLVRKSKDMYIQV